MEMAQKKQQLAVVTGGEGLPAPTTSMLTMQKYGR